MTEPKFAFDCRYFLGDRPCVWHKLEGSLCTCEHYEAVQHRILVIKLAAIGDVLRTTCLLQGIHSKYPGAAITWITQPESVPLLQNNPLIAEVVPYGAEAILRVFALKFDSVINLDTQKESLLLASAVRADQAFGYRYGATGKIQCSNAAARDWFQMGLLDSLKRENRRTYQEIMADILEVSSSNLSYVLSLSDDEIECARRSLVSVGLDPYKPVVGLHTGGGDRWQWKKWTESGFTELIEALSTAHGKDLQLLLLGGAAEAQRNERILKSVAGKVIDAGTGNSLRHFAAILSFCDVLVCADSLAMHIALALERRVVVLFGPTSAHEIELYGLGTKIIPPLDCLGCYKTRCDFQPNCMESISSEDVRVAVLDQLKIRETADSSVR